MQLDSAGLNAAIRRPRSAIRLQRRMKTGNFEFCGPQKQKKPENRPKIGKKWPRKAAQGHSGQNFHHFFVLEPPPGHFYSIIIDILLAGVRL